MSWKNIPLWLKGGIIFGILAIIYVIIFYGAMESSYNLLLYPDSCILQDSFPASLPALPFWCYLVFGPGLIFHIPIWFIYGCIIGWIYGKIKKK